MKQPAYHSPSLPISMSHKDYQEDKLAYMPIEADSLSIGPAVISLKGIQGLYKNDLMVLEMLSQRLSGGHRGDTEVRERLKKHGPCTASFLNFVKGILVFLFS